MVVPIPLGSLDLWTLLVDLVFGGFWMSVIGMALVIFIIMGFLGRISIFTCQWYISMFVLSMSLGYGMATVNLVLSTILVVMFMFSLRGYLDRTGQ